MTIKSNISLSEELAQKAVLFEEQAELDHFLNEVVAVVADYTGAEMAAIFLYEHKSGELVFKAKIDRGCLWENHAEVSDPKTLRFGLDENIAGRAFAEGRALLYHGKEAPGETPSKLVIPLRRGTEKIGVVVVAHREKDFFATETVALLKAATSQIGTMLESASVFLKVSESRARPSSIITGRSASDGISRGKALLFETSFEDTRDDLTKETDIEDIDQALVQFDRSLQRSIRQVEKLQHATETSSSEMVSIIFSTHVLILRDDNFTGKMRELIKDGVSASKAVRTVVNEYATIFGQMSEARLAEKAQDVRDLGYRLLKNLSSGIDDEFDFHGQIAIVRRIFPSDLFRLSFENIAGVVLLGANLTAHLSILAGSLSLPVIITDDKAVLEIENGTDLLLDGTHGTLFIGPSSDLISRYKSQLSAPVRVAEKTDHVGPGSTKDGTKVQILATVNILGDAEGAARQGAEGIGLYRSEFPFIINNDFLSEEQQYKIYRKIVQTMPGKAVTLRTADIGGDKLMQGRGNEESNPFLGVRGIRFSLANRDLFREQLRAFLRAGFGSDLRIMLPMVSGVEEVLQAREETELCIHRLRLDGVPHNDSPKIGAMVELPSAAMAMDDLVDETDFLSIGTNDLTMYLLAVDRTNENLSHLYRSHHPTVLRTLAQIASGAASKLPELSVCGESSTDPVLVPFFIGLGIRKLSVPPKYIVKAKTYISLFTTEMATSIADELLSIRKVHEMDLYLKDFNTKYPIEYLE